MAEANLGEGGTTGDSTLIELYSTLFVKKCDIIYIHFFIDLSQYQLLAVYLKSIVVMNLVEFKN